MFGFFYIFFLHLLRLNAAAARKSIFLSQGYALCESKRLVISINEYIEQII